jgi:phosphoenolpyruvate carboxykinase (GTP)
MAEEHLSFLQKRLDKHEFDKLAALENKAVIEFVAEYIELCNPKSVYVRSDRQQDVDYIRQRAIELGEERELKTQGHTVHFDGPFDQGRDKKATRYLVPKDSPISYYVNCIEKEEGRREIRGIMKDIMAGREMFICFFCLGPVNSDFSILACQITDSTYVAHSEDILYRPGYGQFKKNKNITDFFRFVHSAGELKDFVSKNVDKRRIYIDLENQLVYSANTQYAGNTVGLKKLSLRLAIQKASRENWLAEHMFLMGVNDLSNKKAYFAGAYPSMCGKTSTAMISGETIVGDDIAYLRIRDGKAYAVNVERGIFGIIKDVNSKDDPLLFEALKTPGEVIFSNVLIDEEGVPFWIGKSSDSPHRGINFAGSWHPGKADQQGNEIPPSHKNARYTIRLSDLENVDENLENAGGVEVKGLIYGGRDSDTSVPVEEAFSWQHGIITKAANLESETTAATLGQEGVRSFNPMSNMDFLSVPLGRYVEMNLEFGARLNPAPKIFSVNYFLRDKQGRFLNGIQDKRVWLKWMRMRSEGAYGALSAPCGLIPAYEDLRNLFHKVLGREYSQEEYDQQFLIRIPENLAKIERIRNIYKELKFVPDCLFEELKAQEERLTECRDKFGDYVKPGQLSRI